MTAEVSLTRIDVRLLRALERRRNVVRAARDLRIGRDRAVYRLRRLARLIGPVTTATRGGKEGGATRLTARGRRLLARAVGGRAVANRWSGRYRGGPPPTVEVAPGRFLEVAFHASEGARVEVEVAPDAMILARRPAQLSARNALRAVVEDVRRRADGTAVVRTRWGAVPARARITWASVQRLGIVPGRPILLYVKALNVHRAPSPARLRS